MKMDSNFNVIDFKIVKGNIIVKNKLTYNEVDKLLDSRSNAQLNYMLKDLAKFSLRQKNRNKTKEKYRELENKIYQKSYHQSTRTNYSQSANIVQESMVLTNQMIPKYFKKLSLPYPNRVLHIPDKKMIERELILLLSNNNITLTKKEIEVITNELANIAIGATYSIDDYGHDGIGCKYYSHSTSPLRRAMDSYSQYIIYDFIFNNKRSDFNINKWHDDIHKMCNYLNNKKHENELFANQYNYLASKKLIKTK